MLSLQKKHLEKDICSHMLFPASPSRQLQSSLFWSIHFYSPHIFALRVCFHKQHCWSRIKCFAFLLIALMIRFLWKLQLKTTDPLVPWCLPLPESVRFSGSLSWEILFSVNVNHDRNCRNINIIFVPSFG